MTWQPNNNNNNNNKSFDLTSWQLAICTGIWLVGCHGELTATRPVHSLIIFFTNTSIYWEQEIIKLRIIIKSRISSHCVTCERTCCCGQAMFKVDLSLSLTLSLSLSFSLCLSKITTKPTWWNKLRKPVLSSINAAQYAAAVIPATPTGAAAPAATSTSTTTTTTTASTNNELPPTITSTTTTTTTVGGGGPASAPATFVIPSNGVSVPTSTLSRYQAQSVASRRMTNAGGGERVIRFRCFLQNTILDVLKSRGWLEVAE